MPDCCAKEPLEKDSGGVNWKVNNRTRLSFNKLLLQNKPDSVWLVTDSSNF